jgi:hypothetical protein
MVRDVDSIGSFINLERCRFAGQFSQAFALINVENRSRQMATGNPSISA